MAERKCLDCGGSGECVECYGSGKNCHLNSEREICDLCHGTGKCRTCGGKRTGFHFSDVFNSVAKLFRNRVG